MEIPKERLEKMLDKYVAETFGESFTFREQQKEVVLDIVAAFFDATCNLYLLDAPTGSGKSLIAMIVGGFLTQYKVKGYILASDLALQTQYEKDFRKFNLQWGSIKGVDNYMCTVNSERFSLGECRLKNTSYEEAETLPCFPDCGYLFSRKLAIKSPVSLLNYSYWLIQRNYVEGKMQDRGKGVPFPKRDFTLCDEAHKVPEIVQNHFSPRVDERTVEKMEKVRSVLQKNNLTTPRATSTRLRAVVRNMFKENDQEKIYALLKEFEIHLAEFVKAGASIKEYVASRFPKEVEVPKEWRINMGMVDWVKDMHCKFEDYNHIISQVGIDTMVKNPQGEQLMFHCIDESYMMERHFHSQAGFKLLMTATMGEPATFLKTIGAKNARYFRMDSTFNFEKSPIYFYPKRRMSKAQKDKTLPWVIDKVDEIMNLHPEESGIIHSGSYEISGKIYESLPPDQKKRVLVYQGTREKEEALQRFLSEKNLILMGPSILEGLDLASEKSRFQVFVKVPFPSIGDKFVSAKMNYQPDWYDWRTITSILQGVGRSVRSEEDWAITYFLDGCLVDLLKRRRSSFPPEIQRRIKVVNEDI
jgi:Rad3-related DNA helicase